MAFLVAARRQLKGGLSLAEVALPVSVLGTCTRSNAVFTEALAGCSGASLHCSAEQPLSRATSYSDAGAGAAGVPACGSASPRQPSPEPCSSSGSHATFNSLGRYRSQHVGISRGASALSALAEASASPSPASNLPRGQHQHQQHHHQQLRTYHAWYYGSKLRNRAISQAESLEELGEMLVREGHRLDHVNLTALLAQLKRVARAAEEEAVAEATGGSSSSSSNSSSSGSSAVTAAAAAAAARAVRVRVAELAAVAARLVRRRAKWYDPRHAALAVAHTAALRHTDGRLLHDMTGRALARLDEAYSRDVLLLLRGLCAHQHMQQLAAASSPPAVAAAVAPAVPAVAGAGKPYGGAPAVLLGGVKVFLTAKVPTGRMPPENLAGLLRHWRALAPPGRRLGPAVCGVVAADLQTRTAIYAPEPLAGVLATLSAERHALPPPLLDAAAEQFAAHALTHGSGAAAARFLAAVGAQLRLQQQAAAAGEAAVAAAVAAVAEGPAPGGAQWLEQHPRLLLACLELMTRDLSTASLDRAARWLHVLARMQAPLAAAGTASAAAAAADAAAPAPDAAVAGGGAALAAASAAFVRAHSEAVERELPRLRLPAAAAGAAAGTAAGAAAGTAAGAAAGGAAAAAEAGLQRLRASYEALRLPLPRGL